MRLLSNVLEQQNLMHSQMSEGDLRKLVSNLNNAACDNTFGPNPGPPAELGKAVGETLDKLRSGGGETLIDKSDPEFKRNLKIIEMRTKHKVPQSATLVDFFYILFKAEQFV